MSQPKATRTVTVTNKEGVHARAATLIAESVRRFDAKVVLGKGCERVEGTEVLQILSLGAAQGEQLLLEATGQDAEHALEVLLQLFADHFSENEQQT